MPSVFTLHMFQTGLIYDPRCTGVVAVAAHGGWSVQIMDRKHNVTCSAYLFTFVFSVSSLDLGDPRVAS